MSRIPTTRFLLVLSLLTILCAPAAAAVRTDVLSDDGEVIVLKFTFPAYESRTVSIGNEEYLEIAFPSEPVALEAGAPALPHVNRSVIIPDDAKMSLRVLSADYEEIAARIAPSKGNLFRDTDPADVPYIFGAAYDVDGFLPGPLAELKAPYILRDHRGIVVQTNPFQYNPTDGVLRVYSEITLELKAVGAGVHNVLERGDVDRKSRAFHEVYLARFVNYDSPAPSPDYAPVIDEGDMLIICHDEWLDNMAPFVNHKEGIGISTTLVGVSTIGNNETAIQAYIQNAYDTSNLAFVLLVGDMAQVDSHMDGPGAADPIYSKLAGSDNYPDILVGRFSANTEAELDTQVERTVEYELMPATEEDWFWKGVGIASNEGAGQGDQGQADYVHMGEIRDWLLGAGYTEVDEIYQPGASDSQVAAAVNVGRGVMNYTGHGSATTWVTSGFNNTDVNALTNQNKLPFIVSVACNNGEFESYNACFAEAWMRATHDGEPTGAVAMYASTILMSWAPPMEGQDEFNLLLTNLEEPYHSFGALCFAGSSSMMDDYGTGGVNMFNTWIVFGDPSLRVRGTVEPQTGLKVSPRDGLVAEGPAGGPMVLGATEFTLQNLDDAPIDYVVTADAPWLELANESGTIPVGGSAMVSVTLNGGSRNFDNGQVASLLDFVNLTDHSGDTTRTVTLKVGIPELQHSLLMDEDPGWSMQALWEFGPPLGLGGVYYGNPDPPAAASGQNVYGVALTRGDYKAYVNGPWYLTSSAFALAGGKNTTLTFERWLNTEALPVASATIEASVDGVNWEGIWSNEDEVADNAWTSQSVDLAAVADGQSQVFVRWGYGVLESEAQECSGWNIDDVRIWTVPDSVHTILTVHRDELSWTPIDGAAFYDVVTGSLGTLLATRGDFSGATLGCVADNEAATVLDYGNSPDRGQGYWYLVRGVSQSEPMTFQSFSPNQIGVRDDGIAGSGVSCP